MLKDPIQVITGPGSERKNHNEKWKKWKKWKNTAADCQGMNTLTVSIRLKDIFIFIPRYM